MNYEYSNGNKFSVKKLYMYSPFRGEEFIEVFLRHRYNYLALSQQDCILVTDLIHKLTDFVEENKINSDQEFSPGIDEVFFSKYGFIDLFYKLNNPETNKISKILLKKFVRKFEITQKIYEFYPGSLGLGFGRVDHVSIYLMFGCCLVLNYLQEKNFQSLSTLIKLNDKLISVFEHVPFSESDKYCLSIAVSAEIGAVNDWRAGW